VAAAARPSRGQHSAMSATPPDCIGRRCINADVAPPRSCRVRNGAEAAGSETLRSVWKGMLCGASWAAGARCQLRAALSGLSGVPIINTCTLARRAAPHAQLHLLEAPTQTSWGHPLTTNWSAGSLVDGLSVMVMEARVASIAATTISQGACVVLAAGASRHRVRSRSECMFAVSAICSLCDIK
jgi:hypothetical protein